MPKRRDFTGEVSSNSVIERTWFEYGTGGEENVCLVPPDLADYIEGLESIIKDYEKMFNDKIQKLHEDN